MHRLRATLVATVGLWFVVTSAFAWEVSLKGDWHYGYDYFTQAGTRGFFGPYDQASAAANASGTKFNTMNSFVGFRTINGVQYGIVTGSDASLDWMRMELPLEIRLNPAVEFHALYQIGYGVSQYGLYPSWSAMGVWNPIASGTWTDWWFTAKTPGGILVAGKRPLIWGIGALFDQNNATTELLGIVPSYGPFRMGLLYCPWRGQTWVNSMADRNVVASTLNPGPQGTADAPPADVISYRLWDNERKQYLHPEWWFIFAAGNFEAGYLGEWYTVHNGPGGATSNANALRARTYDGVYDDGSVYFKYNNGRFFFNNELAWVRGQVNIAPAQADVAPINPGDGGGSVFGPHSYEAWKYLAEFGAMAGPSKLSFLYSWVPGPDRRHGIWIKGQSWENTACGWQFGNTVAFLPYSLLMGYQYGAGLNAINRNGEGYMTDASSMGARLDYALAANLNVYGTFFYANRVSKGWGWGCLVPASDTANGGGGKVLLLGQQFTPDGIILTAPQNNLTNPAPSIPDDSLGWEVTAGFDWKLLESLTASMRGAYWQPGGWFKYACVDRRFANTVTTLGGITLLRPAATDGPWGWAVNPDREINPIFGFQGTLEVTF